MLWGWLGCEAPTSVSQVGTGVPDLGSLLGQSRGCGAQGPQSFWASVLVVASWVCPHWPSRPCSARDPGPGLV